MPILFKPETRIPLIYVGVGMAWILLTDATLRWLPPGDPAFWPESLKGLFFVLFTGLLLHWLVKRDVDAIAAADRSAMRPPRAHCLRRRASSSARGIPHASTRFV